MKDLDRNGGVPTTPGVSSRRLGRSNSDASLDGRVDKTYYRSKHTGWAVAVGRKHAEKIGVPLSSKFFETKHQDPVMLMSRPLFPRPSTVPMGISDGQNKFNSKNGKGNQAKQGTPLNQPGPSTAKGSRPPRFQFKSASDRVPFENDTHPFFRSASERVSPDGRIELDRRCASERMVYDEDV